MSISNHRTPAVFMGYNITQDSTKRAALEQVAVHLRARAAAPTVAPIRRQG